VMNADARAATIVPSIQAAYRRGMITG
jgi:hypothetical protein